MEGFEHVVKVALEAEGLIVTGNLKFPVTRKTRKTANDEHQTHGYEVDLVGARRDKLVLASVKSFFGSQGVGKQGFKGLADESRATHFRRYLLFNDLEIQSGVIAEACRLFQYAADQIELRLYVGKFKGPTAQQEIANHLAAGHNGFRPVRVIGLDEIVPALLKAAGPGTYVNDPVVVTIKALRAAGFLPKPKKATEF